MNDELLPWYNSELRFVRRMGQRFARENEKIDQRLGGLGNESIEDPHVARLIEAFAYLNARTRYKLDDDIPEITEAFLDVLYPHFLSPVPSMAIAQLRLNQSQAEQTGGHSVPAGTLLESAPIEGEPCRFRSGYEVNLWPIRVTHAALTHGVLPPVPASWMKSAQSLLEIRLATLLDAVAFSQMPLKRLRFFIKAQTSDAGLIYEQLFNNVLGIAVGSEDRTGPLEILGSTAIRPVGFDTGQVLLPLTARSLPAYAMLTEYFAFPEKFLFFDIDLSRVDLSSAGRELHLRFYLNREAPELEPAVETDCFQLGCTPIINLFSKTAEPIRLTQAEYEYCVVPDARRRRFFEIYSIDGVTASAPDRAPQQFRPFYSTQHGDESPASAYWHASRRMTESVDDPGTDLWMSLVDLNYEPQRHVDRTVRVQTTCFNRDLPRRLPFGRELPLQFAEATGGVLTAACLTRPTAVLRPPLRHGTRWRLISQLCSNPLSLIDSEQDGAEGLREILSLYDRAESPVSRDMIAGLLSLKTRRTTGRITQRIDGRNAAFVCRGIEASVHFDEAKYAGGVFLFASVIERFLSLYCSVNSFVRTVATTEQREESLHQWPPRSGDQLVL
jgi:type VI secretion system protein ImpG